MSELQRNDDAVQTEKTAVPKSRYKIRELWMKGKSRAVSMLLLPLLLLVTAAVPGLAESAAGDMDEWTVLCYFCGSDLESKYGYSTSNLAEISQVNYSGNILANVIEEYGAKVSESTWPGRVNILIETGGAKQWHAGEVGMDIDAGALQRWRYDCYPLDNLDAGTPVIDFELLDTLPPQSMADPQTLTDFIR